MWIILSALFILSSVIFIPRIADNFWIPKNALFLIGGLCLLGYNLISKQEKSFTFKNKWIGLILIYVILSFGWYFYMPLIMAKTGQRVMWNVWNYLVSFNVIVGILLIKELVEYTNDLKHWVGMAKVLCWVCFIFSVYALLQFFGLDQIFCKAKWVHPNKMITFLGNSMHTANFIAMLSPMCLMFKDFRYKAFYILAFIVLVLINSTISMVAFLAGFLIYQAFMNRWKLCLCLVLWLLVAGVFIYQYHPEYFYFSERIATWKLVFNGCKESFIFGSGLGSVIIKKYMINDVLVNSALNEFLQVLHDGGIILFVLVCGYLVNLARRIIMAKSSMLLAGYTIGFAVYLILATGSFIFWVSPLALVGIMYISAIEAQI